MSRSQTRSWTEGPQPPSLNVHCAQDTYRMRDIDTSHSVLIRDYFHRKYASIDRSGTLSHFKGGCVRILLVDSSNDSPVYICFLPMTLMEDRAYDLTYQTWKQVRPLK